MLPKKSKMVSLNYSKSCPVTKNGCVLFEIGDQLHRDQCQKFSWGNNFMVITSNCLKIIKKLLHKIIYQFGYVTTNNVILKKSPLLKFIRLLKWSCLGHNNMNQAKNPEYRNGRVDIAVEQCGPPPKRVKRGHLLSDYRQKCVNATRDILMSKVRKITKKNIQSHNFFKHVEPMREFFVANPCHNVTKMA